MKPIHPVFIWFGLSILILLAGCNTEDENNPITPANKFVGKYRSEVPILVKVKTDFCTNVLEDVATMDWNVNWEVTETNDPNIIDITMTYSSSNFTIINNGCNSGTGYLPEPQPIHMKGYVTDNAISVVYANKEIFTMDYLINELTGELSYSYCVLYCQEIYTNENSFSIAAY